MGIRHAVLGIGIAWLAACAAADREEGDTRADGAAPRAESALLVSTGWLAEHLDDPGVVVLHVGSDRAGYDRGHIPGARFLPLDAIIVERDGNINELPPVAHLDSVFESLGVSDGTRVVVYGPPLAAARAFFTLDYLGHGDRTALLDGGIEAWAAEDRPLSTESPVTVPGSFTPRPRPELVVTAGWIKERLGDPYIALLDARPEDQFSGATPGAGVPRPGHIPGAVNIFWERMIQSTDEPRLRDVAALRALFREAGIEPGDTVVAYCRTGMQASYAYFVSRVLGYETRLYDGSFMDWSRREALPVSGPATR